MLFIYLLLIEIINAKWNITSVFIHSETTHSPVPKPDEWKPVRPEMSVTLPVLIEGRGLFSPRSSVVVTSPVKLRLTPL